MKKTLCLALTALLVSAFAVSAAAADTLATVGKKGDYDDIQLPGTTTPPVIDGTLDDCYVKIHDFYAPDEAMWYDNEDVLHEGKGEAWGTWDKDNFYAFFKVEEEDYFPQNGEADPPGSNYSSMYLALLATPPVNDLPENDNYVMQCSFNRSIEDTKEWKYTGSVPEQYRDNSGAYAIYDTFPFEFEVVNDGVYTYYEVAMPWDQIDRTGTVDFSEGHEWFFNYIITFTTDSGHAIVQYGQGLMNDIYDMGGIVTLTAAPGGDAAPAAEPAEAPAASGERAVVGTGADGSLQIPKAVTAPVMDGVLDDSYAKLHDFYDSDGFRTDYDADKTIKGSSYTAWDENNFYMFLDVETPEYEPIFDVQAIDMGIGPAGYVALLGTADGSYTDEQRFEIGIALADEDIPVWKVSSPADIKDSSADNFYFDECPFNFGVRRDEATSHIFYEFGIPWSFLDRTEMLTYDEGSQFILNYAANVHTTTDYSNNASHIVEFGGGIWAGSYTDGAVVTLVGAPGAAAEEAPAAPTYPASGTEGNAIVGTVIGNETGWGDNAAAGAAAAFDGDVATFFDPLGVGDGFCGIDAGEAYILDKVVIMSRADWNARFKGAMIQGSNDGENWTTLWTSDGEGTNPDWYTVTEFENNTGYSQFRYFNESEHGDVAEVEFYGNPGKIEEAPADPNAPAILWDFNADMAMDANMGANSGANVVSWTGETDADGNDYYVFTASGSDPYVSVDLSADDVSDVVWAKARVKNAGPALSIELYGATDGRGLAGPECTHIDLASDGEWHTYLISIPEENVKTANAFKGAELTETYWTGAVNWIRLDPMWIEGDGATEDGDQIMIDYIAFFPTKEAAEAFRSEQDNAYAPAVDQALDQKAEAPNTFDFGVVAAVAAVISLGGFAVSKKKH